MLTFLLEQNGAATAVNTADNRKKTPLFLACKHAHVECAKFLLKHKANPNSTAQGGLTPLHVCAMCPTGELAQALLEVGADVNKPDDNHITPLHNAGALLSFLTCLRLRL